MVKNAYLALEIQKRILQKKEMVVKAKIRMTAVHEGRKARKIFRKYLNAILRIQGGFKMKKELGRIDQRKSDFLLRKRLNFIQQQKERCERKKREKKAALVINDAMFNKLKRKKLKEVRSYLKNLPFEIRCVYFKFLTLKKDSLQLYDEFELTVAKL